MDSVIGKIILYFLHVDPVSAILLLVLTIATTIFVWLVRSFMTSHNKHADALNNVAGAQRDMNGTMKAMDRTLQDMDHQLQCAAKRDTKMTEILIELRAIFNERR